MDRRGKFNIEELNNSQLLLVWVIALSLFLFAVMVGWLLGPKDVFATEKTSFFAVAVDQVDTEEIKTPEDFFVRGEKISASISTLTPWNQDFFLYLNIYRQPKAKDAQIGYEITPFKLSITTKKYKHEDDEVPSSVLGFSNTKADEDPIPKIFPKVLNCPAHLLATVENCPAPGDSKVGKCGICERITLAHETFVDSFKYTITVQITNHSRGEMHNLWAPLVNDIKAIELVYKFPSNHFTTFELSFRYALVVISVFMTIVFYIANARYNSWKDWALEQKWTFILLVSLVMFNNPFFIFNIVSANLFFPFFNVVAVSTYLITYLMCVLLFTDNLYKPHRRISNAAFYYPKFVLLGVLWCVGLISFAVTRSRQREDIAENDLENVELKGLKVFKVFTGIIVGTYTLWLAYLIIRVVGQWANDSHSYISRRVRFLWFTAVLFLSAIVAGLYVLVLQQNETMKAVDFYSLFAVYNLYTYLLAFFYFPTGPRQPTTKFPPPSAQANAPQEVEVDENLIFDEEDDI